MSKSVFELEQSILQCWNVCDDLDLLYSQTMERSTPLTRDEMSNILLGMKELYQLKFQKCFSEFEELCEDHQKYRKIYDLFQRARDDLK